MRISDWSSDVCSSDLIDKIAPDGATIIVDPSDKLLVDRALYLMMNGTGGATVKLFFSDPARLEPCSNNPEHQTIYPGEEPFFVICRVIWEVRQLRQRGFMTITQRALLVVSGLVLLLVDYTCAFFPSYSSNFTVSVGDRLRCV